MGEAAPKRPKYIVIVACKNIRNQYICPGDAKCFVAFMNGQGKFLKHVNEPAYIVGIVDCGGCPGNALMPNLSLLKLQLQALGIKTIDVIHVGTCITLYCPYKDGIIKTLKEKAGVEVIEGTHEYISPRLF